MKIFLECKSSEINKKQISALKSNNMIKETVERFIMVEDLINLLNANNMKNFLKHENEALEGKMIGSIAGVDDPSKIIAAYKNKPQSK